MATIFKSNSIAKKYLATSLKLSLPSDFKLSADFVMEKYTINGAVKTISDILTNTRSTAAGYINDTGAYIVAPPAVPRLHNDSDLGKGLLIEPVFTNQLANSAVPAAQTVTVNISALTWNVLQVWGAGSCAIEIKDSTGNSITSGVSTQSAPFMYKHTASISGAQVTVTPSNLTHFQFYTSALPRIKQTKAPSTGVVAVEINQLNQALFQSLLSTRNEMTVVLRKVEMKDYVDVTKSAAQSGTIMQAIEDTSGKGLFVARQKGGANNKGVLRVLTSTESLKTNIESVSDEVFALAFSSTEAKIFQNGTILKTTISEALTLVKLYIGGGVSWSTTFEQLIKELYVYDRKLTDAELLEIAY